MTFAWLLCCWLLVHNASAQLCSPDDTLLRKRSEFEVSQNGRAFLDSLCEGSPTPGSYHLGTFSWTSNFDSRFSRANVTYTCYNDNNYEVVNGTINLTFSRKLLWLYDSEHVPPVICEFRGCYEEWSDGMYEAFLMEDIPSCYIDIDECADTTTTACHTNATCTNNETGTYSCECNFNEGYVGNGVDCYENIGPPILDTNLAETVLDEGSDLTLIVSIVYDIMEYLPLTNVSWTLPDSVNVTTDASINSTLPADAGPVTASLHLSDLSPGDSGVYAVTATNDAGSTTLNFTIMVLPDAGTDSVTEDNDGFTAGAPSQTSLSGHHFKRPDTSQSMVVISSALTGGVLLCCVVTLVGIFMLVTRNHSYRAKRQRELRDIHRGIGVYVIEEYKVQGQQTPFYITQPSTTASDLVSMCSLHNFMNVNEDSPMGVKTPIIPVGIEIPMGIKIPVGIETTLTETTKTSCTSLTSQYLGSMDATETSETSDVEETFVTPCTIQMSEASDARKTPRYFESADDVEMSGYFKGLDKAETTEYFESADIAVCFQTSDSAGIFDKSEDTMPKTSDITEIYEYPSGTTETPETAESKEMSRAFDIETPVNVILGSSDEGYLKCHQRSNNKNTDSQSSIFHDCNILPLAPMDGTLPLAHVEFEETGYFDLAAAGLSVHNCTPLLEGTLTDEALDLYDSNNFQTSEVLAPGYLEQPKEAECRPLNFLATFTRTNEENIPTLMWGPGMINLDS